MKCKECKSQIPDGVKYCPNCGALTENWSEPQNQPFNNNEINPQNNEINPQVEQPMNQQTVPDNLPPVSTDSEQQIQKKKKKKGFIIGLIIALVISVASSLITPYINSNRHGTGNAPKNEYEEIAISYFENTFTAMDTEKWLNSNAMDFCVVYEDLVKVFSADANATQEEYFNYISNNYMIKITNAKQLLEADLGIIYDSYDDIVSEEFGDYTISVSVADSKEITDEDLEYYYNKLNDGFTNIGKSSTDYIDKTKVTNAYKVIVEIVIDGSQTSQEYTNVEEYEIIIIKNDNGYEVLYDEYTIDTIIYWLEEEII